MLIPGLLLHIIHMFISSSLSKLALLPRFRFQVLRCSMSDALLQSTSERCDMGFREVLQDEHR